jgi:hypothetical protein
LQKKREEHLCHCQKLAGELLLIILFVHLSKTHTHTHNLSLSLSLSLSFREKLNRLVCSVWFFGRNWLCEFQRKKERKGGDLGFVSRKEEEEEEGDLGVAAALVGGGGGRQRKEEREREWEE